jgi:hypothetical protein
VRIDAAQLEAGHRTASSLRRLGELMESSGDKEKALTAWRELLNGLANGSPEWYEARYESLRLLYESAPSEAIAAMKQHKILHPELGPEPWGSKLRDLDQKMGPGTVSAPAPAAPGGPVNPANGVAPAAPAGKGGGG